MVQNKKKATKDTFRVISFYMYFPIKEKKERILLFQRLVYEAQRVQKKNKAIKDTFLM